MDLFTIDHIIVYAFLTFTLVLGLYYGRGIKTVREYAVANKQYSAIIVTFTLLATRIGSGSTVGPAAELSRSGVVAILAEAGCIIGLMFVIKFFVLKFANEKFKDAISMADLMEILYNREIAIITGILGFLWCAGILGAQFTAMGRLFSTTFNMEYSLAIALCCSIVVFYSTFGGIKSVIATDVMQFCVLVVVIPIITVFAYYQTSTFDDVPGQILNSFSTSISLQNVDYLFYFLILTIPFRWFDPGSIQRFLIVKHHQDIKIALYFYGLTLLFLLPLLTIMGFSIKTLMPNEAPDLITIKFLSEGIPPVLCGITLIGFLAAIMSTADSYLNSASVLLVHNVISPIMGKQKKELLMMKFSTLILGIIAMIIASLDMPIMRIIMSVTGIFGALVGVPFGIALLGLKVSKESFYSSMFVPIAAYLYFKKYYDVYNYLVPFIVIITSVIAFMLMHIIQNKGIAFEKSDNKQEYKQPWVVSIYQEFAMISEGIRTLSFSKILEWTDKKVKTQGLNQWLFCLYFWISLSVSVAFWMKDISYFYMQSIIVLIIITGILSIILLIKEAWSEWALKYYSLYWHITIMMCLPYINTVMFCLNRGDYYESMSLIMSLMILALLVDWISFFILSLLGMFLGYMHYALLMGDAHVSISNNIGDDNPVHILMGVTLAVISITVMFFRTKDNMMTGRLKTLEAFGGTMAHEVKTPLSSNQSSLSLMESIMDEESDIRESGDEVNIKLSKDNYKVMRYAMELMKKSNKSGKETVDMLLMSMKEGGELQGRKDQLSLKACIDEALEEYGFERDQREQVQIRMKNDISFIGDKEHIKHIIFNLIKNTFKHGGSDVNIEMIIEGDRLRFKDNGMGIAADKLPKIFDKFYTGSNTGTGLGLSFSKDIMKSIGGTIECESKEGEYTEFILDFSINTTNTHIKP